MENDNNDKRTSRASQTREKQLIKSLDSTIIFRCTTCANRFSTQMDKSRIYGIPRH